MTEHEKLVQLRERFDYLRKTHIENGKVVAEHEAELKVLIREFCKTFLMDRKRRPLILTPFEEDVVILSLCSRELMILAPRGSGKSWALAVAIVMWMYFYRSGEEVIIIAPLDKQAKRIFDYVITHFRNSPELSSLYRNIRERNEPAIHLVDGSFCWRTPISAAYHGQNIRGAHPTFLVVDESPYIPDSLFEANVEPCYKANEAPFINIGTPFSRDNHSYKYYYHDDYKTFTRKKFGWEYCAEKGDAYEAHFKKEEVLLMRKRWGADSMKFKREYLCEFVEAEGHFFSTNMLKGAYYDLGSFIKKPDMNDDYFITIDPGRQMNSYVWILWRRTRDGDVEKFDVVKMTERIPKDKPLNFVDVRREILHEVKKFGVQAIVLDTQGIGAAQIDDFTNEMEQFGIEIPLIGIQFSSAKKGEYYEQYQFLIQNGVIGIPYPDSMKSETQRLMVEKCIRQHLMLGYKIGKDNQLIISVPKSEHDDYPDAMCYVVKLVDAETVVGGGIAAVKRENIPPIRGGTKIRIPSIKKSAGTSELEQFKKKGPSGL